MGGEYVDFENLEEVAQENHEKQITTNHVNGFVNKAWYTKICEQVKNACEKHHLQYLIKSNRIYIMTPYDSWYFDVRYGKICLMHKSLIENLLSNDGYHVQFKEEISIEDLVTYIREHTDAKYGNNFVNFTVKIGGTK